VTISIARPPAGGNGNYVLWTYDGVPAQPDERTLLFQSSGADAISLGIGCRSLPINNTVNPGSCPCPLTFPLGRASQSLAPAKAAVVCVNSAPGFPRYPTSFQQTFPPGVFTLGGLLVDLGSPNQKPLSVMNWVIVVAR